MRFFRATLYNRELDIVNSLSVHCMLYIRGKSVMSINQHFTISIVYIHAVVCIERALRLRVELGDLQIESNRLTVFGSVRFPHEHNKLFHCRAYTAERHKPETIKFTKFGYHIL